MDGPITDVRMPLARASYFSLTNEEALAVLAEVHAAVRTGVKSAQSGGRPAFG